MRNFTDGQILTAEDINNHLLNRDTEARREGMKYLEELKEYQKSLIVTKQLSHKYLNSYANLRRFDFTPSTQEAFKTETHKNLRNGSERYLRCQTNLKSIEFGIVGTRGYKNYRVGPMRNYVYSSESSGWIYHYINDNVCIFIGRNQVSDPIVVWIQYYFDSDVPGREGDSKIPFYCTGENA